MRLFADITIRKTGKMSGKRKFPCNALWLMAVPVLSVQHADAQNGWKNKACKYLHLIEK